MMRVLLDTDVILDVFLKREPFAEAAAELWRANELGLYEGYVSAITPVNLFYVARKIKDATVAHAAVTDCLPWTASSKSRHRLTGDGATPATR